MFNTPSKEILNNLPGIGDTKLIPYKDKIIYLRFSIDNSKFEWYIAEYDGFDNMWGFVIFNGEVHNGNWRHVSFHTLKTIHIPNDIEVIFDAAWQPKKASEIYNVFDGMGWDYEDLSEEYEIREVEDIICPLCCKIA